ncbi:hypothetical protein RFI_31776 [Reticulomyxa filosa]|uniref:Protein kinase domain-containing protein n=1 Tax=Reticulomyxa filosa TaxID=46433 RepID=X6LY13_RETFI|nr:hypothetical protein RFI_31776 [Reticulomyxa filosa]|eukprot:ETO05620.1 hypothetical protein RFI_31776 [Reticulomyxa filosa]
MIMLLLYAQIMAFQTDVKLYFVLNYYRYLKPENILLDQSSYAYLTDFGLFKELTNGKKATVCFHFDIIFSVLLIANQLIDVVVPPFYFQNIHKMYYKIQGIPLSSLPNLAKKCKDVISNVCFCLTLSFFCKCVHQIELIKYVLIVAGEIQVKDLVM